jgi:uncharacterized protein (TIGR02001 family)
MRLPTPRPRALLRLLIIPACALLACVLATPALAQEAATESPWSFEVVLESEYISKGTGKSEGEPALELGVKRELGPAYAGAWAGTVKTSQGGDAEVHLYVGAATDVGPFELDGRITYKTAPGTADGFQDDWIELRGVASTEVAGTELSLKVEFSPDNYALTKEAWWIEGEASREVAPGWTVSAAYGAREQNGGADYRAWNAGVTWEVREGVELDLRWYDTDSHDLGENYDGRVFAALILSF